MEKTRILGGACHSVSRKAPQSLAVEGAAVLRAALADAGLQNVQAVYVANMLADELQNSKHLAALIAGEAGMTSLEALEMRAAMASGAAALRAACLAIESGQVQSVAVLGIEQMSVDGVQSALAKALHPAKEQARGETMLSIVARLMSLYLQSYGAPIEGFANFAVNARENSLLNPNALFQKSVTIEEVNQSRIVAEPMRLYDCAPICDGAACVVLGNKEIAEIARTPAGPRRHVNIVGSAVAIDTLAVSDRNDPLALEAARVSAGRAYQMAGLGPKQIDFFEVHDAFSIMAALSLEACGFAERGHGWRLADEGAIFRDGRLPLQSMGGLLGRGHPIGATAIYQALEAYRQICGAAGPAQLRRADCALLQSVGGAGATLITHILRGA